MNKQTSKIKIGLVTSRGGHLFQLYQLKEWWQIYDRFWITESGGDSDYLLKKERLYYGFFPESRNVINAIKNAFLGLKILRQEKPDLLVSCGAGIAPPFFLIGKLLGCKLLFIEPYDFIHHPSLSGKLLYHFVDIFLVQHRSQLRFFPKAQHWGASI